jgi:hypothetical protein
VPVFGVPRPDGETVIFRRGGSLGGDTSRGDANADSALALLASITAHSL